MLHRAVFQKVRERLSEPRRWIQVLLGPRQVGKTTLALQISESLRRPCHYASADLATLQDLSWLRQQWEIAREMAEGGRAVLAIDEAQKIPQWSEMVKSLWDADTRSGIDLQVLLLGSSPWLMQQGLAESLAGRFEVTPVTHWSLGEMSEEFGWELEEYIYFGGYPGAAPLANREDVSRWTSYVNDALIETAISRDILLMTRIHKPALLRRLFQLSCSYSGQILSYQKMTGQLQDAGNVTTLAHYLDLLSGAGLVTGLQKYANQSMRRRGSSPKLQVLNTALMSAQLGLSFEEARRDRATWGRLVESAVGAHLLNSIRGTQWELYYWREGDAEVDFVLQKGKQLIAIEVKSGNESLAHSGMDRFVKQFNPGKVLLVGGDGMPLEDFFLRFSL
jgi:uncharacterized protein